jgi:hypothetical protein
MRLLAPGSAPLDNAQCQHLLSELTKVRAHFHFAPLSVGVRAETGPPEIAK